jgi:uncharacterized phage infection (PIP) family protein YhgE
MNHPICRALICIVLAAATFALFAAGLFFYRLRSEIPEVRSAILEQADAIRNEIGSLHKELSPVLKNAATAEAQANGLLSDVRRELPAIKTSLQDGILGLTAAADSLGASAAEISKIHEDLRPAVAGVNQLFRRDELPKSIPALVRDLRLTATESAETAKTIRDVVKNEAGPTAQAIRKSAEGTATSTANASALIADSDTFVKLTTDLIYGKRTFWQRMRAFMWGVASLGARTAGAW